MAKIIDNLYGRRSIKVSTDDVINIVREYQNVTYDKRSYEDIRKALNKMDLYIPEEI